METKIKEGLYRSPRSGRLYNAIQIEEKVMVEVIRTGRNDALKQGDSFEFGLVSDFPECLHPYGSEEEIKRFHGIFPESLKFV